MTTATPGRTELARIIKAAMTGAHTGKIIPAEEIGFAEIYDRNFLVAADAVLARLAAKPAEEVREALAQRLRDAAQTAQNDDLSKPRSEKRQRHIIRVEAMLDASEYLLEIGSPTGEPKP